MTDPVIINAALTGAVLTKQDTDRLPVTPDEIAIAAKEAYEAGAAIVHVHVRNSDGSNSQDPRDFVDAIAAVRAAAPDLIVCMSLTGRVNPDVAARAAGLVAGPELASLTVGSMNFATGPSVNSPQVIQDLAERIYAVGARPELEIFEPGFAHMANVLAQRGILKAPFYANIILGALGASPLHLAGLANIISLLPPETTWSVGGLGKFQLDANLMAISAGGHVRTGIEDNMYLDRSRTRLASTGQLVERIARIADLAGRPPATPAQARAMLGLAGSSA